MTEKLRSEGGKGAVPGKKKWPGGILLVALGAIIVAGPFIKGATENAKKAEASRQEEYVRNAEIYAAAAEALLIGAAEDAARESADADMKARAGAETDSSASEYLSSGELVKLFSEDHWFCAGYDAETATCANISTTRTVNNRIVETYLVTLSEDGMQKADMAFSMPLVGNAQCAVMEDLVSFRTTFYAATDRTPVVGRSQPVIGQFRLIDLPEEDLTAFVAEITGGAAQTYEPQDRVCERYVRQGERHVRSVTEVNGVSVAPSDDDLWYLARPGEVSLRP